MGQYRFVNLDNGGLGNRMQREWDTAVNQLKADQDELMRLEQDLALAKRGQPAR